MILPTFTRYDYETDPKQFLWELETYLERKKAATEDEGIIIGNCQKERAAAWYTMIKDAEQNVHTFKQLFLKYFFSDKKKWDIFLQCTEAGKKQVEFEFEAHFNKWMNELKSLDTPKAIEEQGISLTLIHFPITVQALVENGMEKRFMKVWEKLDEIEDHQIRRTKKNTGYSMNSQQAKIQISTE